MGATKAKNVKEQDLPKPIPKHLTRLPDKPHDLSVYDVGMESAIPLKLKGKRP